MEYELVQLPNDVLINVLTYLSLSKEKAYKYIYKLVNNCIINVGTPNILVLYVL